MKFRKLLAALTMMLAVMVGSFGMTVLAAEDGTREKPYLGGYDYGSTDDGRIILHKLDIAKFERVKAAELIGAGLLSAGGTVTYTGGIPTGVSLTAGNVVGSYTTSDEPAVEYSVTLGELNVLGNIIFRIEQVQLGVGKLHGSTDPSDYEPVSTGVDGYAKTDSAGQISWRGLADSYYRITEEVNETGQPVGISSYIVSVPMVDPADDTKTVTTVHLYPKNRAATDPLIEKDKPVPDDYNGNILSWTIRSEIPANLKAEKGNQRYVVTDTMAAGLKYAGNLKVFYKSDSGEVQLTENTDYTTTAAAGGTSFSITLGTEGFTKLGTALSSGSMEAETDGRYILYVTYDTVVSISKEELEANINPKNEVELDFTNSEGTDYHDEPDPVIVESYAGLGLTKKDGANETVLLPGAHFKIYTKLIDTEVDPDSVLKDAGGNELEFITDSAGRFLYIGLGPGTYYLAETQAPDNYKKLSSYTEVTISAADVDGQVVKEVTVLNYLDNGFTLPLTGGSGTRMFTAVGMILIAAAGLLFALGRKGKRR